MKPSDLRSYMTNTGMTIKTVSEITHIPYRTLQGWLADETTNAYRKPPEWAVYLAVEKLKGEAKMKKELKNSIKELIEEYEKDVEFWELFENDTPNKRGALKALNRLIVNAKTAMGSDTMFRQMPRLIWEEIQSDREKLRWCLTAEEKDELSTEIATLENHMMDLIIL